jgi:GNAT superfamily N-acetyltransferase
LDEFALAAALRQEMAKEMGDDFDARSPEWRTKFANYFSEKQRAGNAQLVIAFDGEEAIGCAVVSVLDDYRRFALSTSSAFVNAVYVKPAHRRRGIARRLMEMVLAWARERGCVRVRLRSSDQGQALYEAIGFKAGREMELYL